MILSWVIILIAGGFCYWELLYRAWSGLRVLSKHQPARLNTDHPQVSVIIAARNEELFLGRTLDAIINQDYAPDQIEIIVIDDRSDDGTAALVERFSERDPRLRLLRQTNINPLLSPKKQALEAGYLAARGPIIITTDADCQPESSWITTLVGQLNREVSMVTGQARFEIASSAPLWQKMQALDFTSQGLLGAGLIAAGFPFNCTGASLAFRKQDYLSVQGFKGVNNLISGDDELLMSKFDSAGKVIRSATGRAATVLTRPPANPSELWHQRIRWGSKGLYYRPSRKLLLMGIFIFLVALTVGPVVCWGNTCWWIWALAMILKLVSDWFILKTGARLNNDQISLGLFLITDLIHPPAMILFAVGGHFGSFQWKNQTFHSRGTKP